METRKPAPIVRCEHCKWQGSSRGLFTHVRLAHPGISEVPPNQTREHPLSINSTKWKEGKYRFSSDTSSMKKPVKYAPLSKEDKADFLTLSVMVPVLIYIFSQPNIKDILTREGVNPNRLVTALGKI